MSLLSSDSPSASISPSSPPPLPSSSSSSSSSSRSSSEPSYSYWSPSLFFTIPASRAEANGESVRLHYQLYGRGEKKILFIMGFACTLQQWAFQIEFFHCSPFAEEFQICVYDNRGIGESSIPGWRTTTSRMAEDGIELIKYLGWREVHVVAKSMGGMIGLELACRATPGLLKSLTIINTHAGGLRFFPPFDGTVLQLGWLKTIFTDDPEHRLLCSLRLRYGRHVEEENPTFWAFLKASHKARIVGTKHPTFKGVVSHLLAVSTHFVSTRRLIALKHSGLPVLICVGTKDLLVRASNSYLLHDILNDGTNCKLECFDNIGHAINNHQYVRFNKMLVQFIREAEQDYKWEAQSPFIRPILPNRSPAARAINNIDKKKGIEIINNNNSNNSINRSRRNNGLYHKLHHIESFAKSLRTVSALSSEYLWSVYKRLKTIVLALAIYGFLALRAYRHYLLSLSLTIHPSYLDRAYAAWKSYLWPIYLLFSQRFRKAFFSLPIWS